MLASAWSAAAGSRIPRARPRFCFSYPATFRHRPAPTQVELSLALAVPLLQHAAIALAISGRFAGQQGEAGSDALRRLVFDQRDQLHPLKLVLGAILDARSEERRVGKECRSRWS